MKQKIIIVFLFVIFTIIYSFSSSMNIEVLESLPKDENIEITTDFNSHVFYHDNSVFVVSKKLNENSSQIKKITLNLKKNDKVFKIFYQEKDDFLAVFTTQGNLIFQRNGKISTIEKLGGDNFITFKKNPKLSTNLNNNNNKIDIKKEEKEEKDKKPQKKTVEEVDNIENVPISPYITLLKKLSETPTKEGELPIGLIDNHIHLMTEDMVPSEAEVEHLRIPEWLENRLVKSILRCLIVHYGQTGEKVINTLKKLGFPIPELIENAFEMFRVVSLNNIGLVFKEWQKSTLNYQKKSQKKSAAVVLSVDFDFGYTKDYHDPVCGRNVKRKDFKNQIDLLFRFSKFLLKKKGKKGLILPTVGIDPRRYKNDKFNLYDLVDQFVVKNGAVAAKLYPNLGFLPTDPRLIPIFSLFNRTGIPIITHYSYGGMQTGYDRIEMYKSDDQSLDDYYKNWDHKNKVYVPQRNKVAQFNYFEHIEGKGYFFNHPLNWKPVLDKFPGLKICFAHFGGSYEEFFERKTEFSSTLFDFMKDYENVYTDLAYTSFDSKGNKRFVKEILQNEQKWGHILDRMMFGTDFHPSIIEKKPTEYFDDATEDFKGYLDQWFKNTLKFFERY